MISTRLQVTGEIREREKLTGELNSSIKEIYPELENIEIEPKLEEQYLTSEKYGFGEIVVHKIQTENIQINPTINKQEYLGIYRRIDVEPVTSEIDKNIQPENIKKGEKILGVDGSYTGLNTEDADALPENLLTGKTAYVKGEKIIGTMPNNSFLEYSATEQEQKIPRGYTDGGIVRAVDITSLADYQKCEALTDMILGKTGGAV